MPKDFGIFASMPKSEEASKTFHPLVSILIPVYNGADFVAEAIQSSLAQTYDNFEIVVVNDGSKDSGATEAAVQAFGDKVRYFSKPNGGVASALNFGIEKCRGEYISWLSHDDLYTPEKLTKQIEYLARHDRDHVILYSDFSFFSKDPASGEYIGLEGVAPENFRFWITMQSALHGCTLLIPKAAFTDVGMFNETLRTTQDYDLWFRMAETYRFTHQRELFVKARRHENQGSVTMADAALSEGNRLLSNYIEQLTPAELRRGFHRSPAISYAMLASHMRSRGYLGAGHTATKLAMREFKNSRFPEIIESIVILTRGSTIRYRLKQVVKFFLPRSVRLKIRGAIAKFFEEKPVLPETVRVSEFDLKKKFSQIYKKNIFEGESSRSGVGSDLKQTAIIRNELPRLLEELNANSVLDAPCGDWCWMKECDLGSRKYIGVDIVPKLIRSNKKKFGGPTTVFRCLNLASDPLPKADVILSRDCLVHLSFEDALKTIKNFKKSGAKYLIATTFVNRKENIELGTSFWRPLNKQLPPFNFPPPLKLVNEGCTEGDGLFSDKCLGVWHLKDL